MSNYQDEDLIYPMMPKGKLVYETKVVATKPEPKQQQSQKQKPRPPAPNWKCYPMIFKIGVNIDHNGNWLGGKLPTCRVCEGLLPPKDNHVCSGFKPKYVENTPEREERWEEKRKLIRESNWNRPKKCIVCHEVMPDLDAANWHEEHCCFANDLPRGKHWYTDYDPIVGDNDGHECYEDEPEEDWCED